jgi:GT2 family glycosyltransferase
MRRVAPVSAAIATLDRPDALGRCLAACLAGTTLPSEIIVVDQSSNDRTRDTIERHEPGPVPIVYIRQPRLGLSASRNAAIARAAFPIIAFTDDDCVPDADWIRSIERTLTVPDAPDGVTGRVLPLGPEVPGLFAVSLRESTERVDWSGKHVPWLVGTGGNFAVWRVWFERAGLFDERLGAGSPGKAAEDSDMFYRLLRAGATIRYEPEVVIYHERQELSRRLGARRTYGYGIGVFCGIRLREADWYAWSVLASWSLHQSLVIVRALRARDWTKAYQIGLSVRGTLSGLLHGLRLRSRRATPTLKHDRRNHEHRHPR